MAEFRPNILWLTLEDTSPRLGCYGLSTARTPAIDRIAREGILYAQAFSTAPVCAPARAAVITGCYATWLGAQHMRTSHTNAAMSGLPTPYACVPPAHVRCISEWFRAAGWFCTNNAKTDYQFDQAVGVPLSAWDRCESRGWAGGGPPYPDWRDRSPGQQFFSVFNFGASHESGFWGAFPGDPEVVDPSGLDVPPPAVDTPATRAALARHDNRIAGNDARIAALLHELEADGLLESTIIVVWSDHGNGLPRGKRWPCDAGLRVPLIVRLPGPLRAGAPAPGSVVRELVSTIDLAPTMFSLAGLPPPPHLQGQAFLGPGRAAAREAVFGHRDRMDEAYDCVRAVREDGLLYVRNDSGFVPRMQWTPYLYQNDAVQDVIAAELRRGPGEAPGFLFEPRPGEELYDCAADPHQLRNLALDPARAADLARLRARLEAWRRDYDRFADIDEAEMVRRWWPAGAPPRTEEPVVVLLPDAARVPLRPRTGTWSPVARTGPALEPVGAEAEVPGPVLVLLASATQGAGIVWTTDVGEGARWRLYTHPIRLEAGTTATLRVRAQRYGFHASGEKSVRLRILE